MLLIHLAISFGFFSAFSIASTVIASYFASLGTFLISTYFISKAPLSSPLRHGSSNIVIPKSSFPLTYDVAFIESVGLGILIIASTSPMAGIYSGTNGLILVSRSIFYGLYL
jgi:hypothetical protein